VAEPPYSEGYFSWKALEGEEKLHVRKNQGRRLLRVLKGEGGAGKAEMGI